MNPVQAYIICLMLTTLTRTSSSGEMEANCDYEDDTYFPIDSPIRRVLADPTKSSDWWEMGKLCNEEYPGYGLLRDDYKNLTDDAKKLCGGEIVPLSIISENNTLFWKHQYLEQTLVNVSALEQMGEELSIGDDQLGTYDTTNGILKLVDKSYTFQCALCQRSRLELVNLGRSLYPEPPEYFMNAKNGTVYSVIMEMLDNVTITGDNDTYNNHTYSLSRKLKVLYTNIHRQNLTSDQSELVYHIVTNKSLEQLANDLKGFVITELKSIDECPAENTTYNRTHKQNKYKMNNLEESFISWNQTRINRKQILRIRYLLDATRECFYDVIKRKAVWSEVTYWKNSWQRCTKEIMKNVIEKIKELSDKNITELDLRYVFERLNEVSQLNLFEKNQNLFKKVHSGFRGRKNKPKLLKHLQNISKIVSNAQLDERTTFVRGNMVSGIIASISNTNSVSGISVTNDRMFSFQSESDNHRASINETSIVDIEISPTFRAMRVACIKYTNYDLFLSERATQMLEHHSNTVNFILHFLIKPAPGFDITRKDGMITMFLQRKYSLFCISELGDLKEGGNCWLTEQHGHLKTVYETGLKNESNIFTGLYFVSIAKSEGIFSYGPPFLLTMLLALGLSVFGLTCIIFTAIFIKNWRHELGHRILLHMTAALALNLALGFIINFTGSLSSDQICIALGVARHYSYLAMFFWMFILAILQARRIFPVLGASSTPNLITKLSVIGWGIPFIPIIILLSLSPDNYEKQNDRYYCYPQGTAFILTIQAPAAIVLFANTVTYFIIVFQINACFGFDNRSSMRNNGYSKKNHNLIKLRTYIFLFFLFGFSWFFHLLSDGGVFGATNLYEYLFLMTAAIHIFILSVFFVFLNSATMNKWRELSLEGNGNYFVGCGIMKYFRRD